MLFSSIYFARDLQGCVLSPPLAALPPLVRLAVACISPVADRLLLFDFDRLSLIGLTLPRASIGLEPAGRSALGQRLVPR